jgi:hypothetical protein
MPSRIPTTLLALVATLLLIGVVPTSASAVAGPAEPVADPQVDAWLKTAHEWWGLAPDCPGGVVVERAERVAGEGVWASAETPGCRISLDPDLYPRPVAPRASAWAPRAWQERMCNVVAHEWGHLLGQAHASDFHDLMAPVVPLVVPGCRAGAPSSVGASTPAAGKLKKSKRVRAGAAKPGRHRNSRGSGRPRPV